MSLSLMYVQYPAQGSMLVTLFPGSQKCLCESHPMILQAPSLGFLLTSPPALSVEGEWGS